METTKVTINSTLSGDHLATFSRAVTNILKTDIAVETFAQIIDGLPIARVVQDTAADTLPAPHPLHKKHQELCLGVLDKTREFRQQFDPGTLQFDATLISDFRASSPGSRVFKIRLVELTAIAIHNIAVQLFNLGLGGHAGDDMACWVPEKDDVFWELYDGPWPTLFRHPWYTAYDQYPSGIADGVGFWAEVRIFGGVILFDRRGPKGDPDSIWYHPDREYGTYRICQLLDEQRVGLQDFLISEEPDLKVLPIAVDDNNTKREDPEKAPESIGIYRHTWERKEIGPDEVDLRLSDVYDTIDYPTRSDLRRVKSRALDRHERVYYPSTKF